MTDLIIRPAILADAAAINEIVNHVITTTIYNLSTENVTIDETEDWLRSHIGKYPVIVAETDGKVSGWASLSEYKSKAGYRLTAENSVYVHKDYLRKGIGTRLLNAICDEALKYGIHRIVAVITANNQLSIDMHIKNGFEYCGCLNEVGYKFGEYVDVVFLIKRL